MCPHVSASWLRPVLTGGGGGGGGRYEWVATHYTPPLRHAARSSVVAGGEPRRPGEATQAAHQGETFL